MIVAASSEVAPSRIILAASPDFDLGGVRVKPSRRQVCPPGEDCRDLEPRVMQVLVALAMARCAVVSRDQLIDSCWEGRIVGDDSLNRCVVALRRLARQIDPQPFTIETVARIGYCLVPNVEPDSRLDEAAPKAAEPIRVADQWPRRRLNAGLLAAAAAAAIALLWLWPSSPDRAQGPPQVRLGSIRLLSPDLPRPMAESFREELTATIEVEDAIMIVTGRGSDPRFDPDLALSATIQEAGDLLRFTVHLRNDRTGASIWSQMFELPAGFALAGRQVAVRVSQVVRCGLNGAGPYLKKMSDQTLSVWLQYCSELRSGEPTTPERLLDSARKMTAVAPEFSPGWSARALLAVPVSDGPDAAKRRRESDDSAAKALRLDPRNAEAYNAKAQNLLLLRKWADMERLLRQAIDARPTDCACEHTIYGHLLLTLGRYDAAAGHYRRARDVQPLAMYSSHALAKALLLSRREDEGRRLLEKTIELWPDVEPLLHTKIRSTFWTGRYEEARTILVRPSLHMPEAQRAALLAAFDALESGRQDDRAAAIRLLRPLAREPRDNIALVSSALAALGDNLNALDSAEKNESWMDGSLFEPSFASARHEPAFAALVERLGMIRYWRATRQGPDFCREGRAPELCKRLLDQA